MVKVKNQQNKANQFIFNEEHGFIDRYTGREKHLQQLLEKRIQKAVKTHRLDLSSNLSCSFNQFEFEIIPNEILNHDISTRLVELWLSNNQISFLTIEFCSAFPQLELLGTMQIMRFSGDWIHPI